MLINGLDRRSLLQATAALTLASGGRAFAQAEPIRIGSLLPLSGSGGPIGPSIRMAQQAAVDEANRAGGVLGRRVELVGEDDQTNPEAGVRAARKLIDADKVVAILGVWASAVASAVAPLCWENKVMMICIGAADSITLLPHGGYVVRTQPSTTQQSEAIGAFAVGETAKRFHIMMPQTPFTELTFRQLGEVGAKHDMTVTTTIYDAKKTSFRSEVDAMVAAKPDVLMTGGYLNDTIVLAKDVYRSGFAGKVVGYAYAISPAFVQAVGPQVAEGIYGLEPMPDQSSSAYDKVKAALKQPEIDIYTCHGYDEVNLTLLAIAAAKQVSGTAVKDFIRKIGDPNGVKVDNVTDGLKALSDGKAINYVGASGPCKFTPIGDVVSANFRVNQVKGGKFQTYKVL